MRLLYTVLLYLITPLVLLRLLWKSRLQPEYRRRIGEAYNKIKKQPRAKTQRREGAFERE